MLKRRLCEARFEWKFSCTGPLLIADGRYEKPKDSPKGKDPNKVFISRAAAQAVQAAVAKSRSGDDLNHLPFYVPGTSLRGPLRAQAERIVRSLRPESEEPPLTACDPFEMTAGKPLVSCSERLKAKACEPPYAHACPACKLFGCTATASRLRIGDADLGGTKRSVYRDMIGIDRFTGGVYQGEKSAAAPGGSGEGGPAGEERKGGGANMRLHALEETTFKTEVTVANFELWQLGWLAYAFRDFEDGLVAIGFGKSKGFGMVTAKVEKIVLTYPRGRAAGRVQHLGSLVADPAEHALYGLREEPPPALHAKPVTAGLSLYESFEVDDPSAFWQAVAPAFDRFVASSPAAGGAAE